MTGILLFFLSFGGAFLFLAGFTPWPVASLPLFTASLITLTLYLSALCGLLPAGLHLTAGLGFALGAAALWRAWKKPGLYSERLKEPGTCFFPLAALLWLAFHTRNFASWDEFSHWGLITKEIFLRGALPPLESAVRFKDYPPAAALFQNFVMYFTGWSEGTAVFAQTLLLLAAAAALLQGSPGRRMRSAAVVSFACLLLPLFNYKFQSLYVDHVLGFFFGAVIASALLSGNGGRGMLIRTLPVLLVLPLIKAAGLPLAAVAGLAIITIHFLKNRSTDPRGGRGSAASLLLCSAILAGPFLSAGSWNRHVRSIGAEKTFTARTTPGAIAKSFSAAAPERDKAVIGNFTKALLLKQTGRALPPFFLILILSAAAFAALRREKRRGERAPVIAAFFWLSAGFCAYASGLLLLYLYSFSDYEAPRLASFGRYLGTFFTGWSLATAAFFLRQPSSAPADRSAGRYLRPLLVLAAAAALVSAALKKPEEEKRLLHEKIRGMAAGAAAAPENARIYTIWQNSDGFEPLVLAYELSPRRANLPGDAWSLGKRYSPEDIWTADLAPEAWRGKLKNYDFVLLGNTDDAFRERFAPLFKDRGAILDGRLYRIPGGPGTPPLQLL